MNTLTLNALALVCALAAASHAQAQMCKWTDENGTVHYDTECPENVDSKAVDVSDAPSTSGDDPYASSRKAAESARNQPKNRFFDGLRQHAREEVPMTQGSTSRNIIQEMRTIKGQG